MWSSTWKVEAKVKHILAQKVQLEMEVGKNVMILGRIPD